MILLLSTNKHKRTNKRKGINKKIIVTFNNCSVYRQIVDSLTHYMWTFFYFYIEEETNTYRIFIFVDLFIFSSFFILLEQILFLVQFYLFIFSFLVKVSIKKG